MAQGFICTYWKHHINVEEEIIKKERTINMLRNEITRSYHRNYPDHAEGYEMKLKRAEIELEDLKRKQNG